MPRAECLQSALCVVYRHCTQTLAMSLWLSNKEWMSEAGFLQWIVSILVENVYLGMYTRVSVGLGKLLFF